MNNTEATPQEIGPVLTFTDPACTNLNTDVRGWVNLQMENSTMEAWLLSFYLKKSSVFLALFVAEPENQGSDILGLQRRHQIWTQHGENNAACYFYPRLIMCLSNAEL